MRVSLALLALICALALPPSVSAQKVVQAWYFIASDAGNEMVQAQAIKTYTDARGRTRVFADRQAVRVDGDIFVIVLGPSRERPDPPPQTQNGDYDYGASAGVVRPGMRPSTRFPTFSFPVKIEGRPIVRVTDMTSGNHATTTTSTSNGDGSTSTTTTTEEGEEEGGETGGGEEGSEETGGGETGG